MPDNRSPNHACTLSARLGLLVLLCLAIPAVGQQAEDNGSQTLTLEQLASGSDFVAVVKVRETDYEYQRGFPVSGTAELEVLISYRRQKEVTRVQVKESGLHDQACYFPRTFLGQDGARFLVFLARHPDGMYRGNPNGCKVPVLVTRDSEYAVRYPLPDGIRLTERQSQWVRTMDYSDPNAYMEDRNRVRSLKEKIAKQVDGEVTERGIRYTKGIPIARVPDLIGLENIQRPD